MSGIWDASFNAQSAVQFDQFAVHVQNVTVSTLTFQFISAGSVWQIVKVGFWASINPAVQISTSSLSNWNII